MLCRMTKTTTTTTSSTSSMICGNEKNGNDSFDRNSNSELYHHQQQQYRQDNLFNKNSKHSNFDSSTNVMYLKNGRKVIDENSGTFFDDKLMAPPSMIGGGNDSSYYYISNDDYSNDFNNFDLPEPSKLPPMNEMRKRTNMINDDKSLSSKKHCNPDDDILYDNYSNNRQPSTSQFNFNSNSNNLCNGKLPSNILEFPDDFRNSSDSEKISGNLSNGNSLNNKIRTSSDIIDRPRQNEKNSLMKSSFNNLMNYPPTEDVKIHRNNDHQMHHYKYQPNSVEMLSNNLMERRMPKNLLDYQNQVNSSIPENNFQNYRQTGQTLNNLTASDVVVEDNDDLNIYRSNDIGNNLIDRNRMRNDYINQSMNISDNRYLFCHPSDQLSLTTSSTFSSSIYDQKNKLSQHHSIDFPLLKASSITTTTTITSTSSSSFNFQNHQSNSYQSSTNQMSEISQFSSQPNLNNHQNQYDSRQNFISHNPITSSSSQRNQLQFSIGQQENKKTTVRGHNGDCIDLLSLHNSRLVNLFMKLDDMHSICANETREIEKRMNDSIRIIADIEQRKLRTLDELQMREIRMNERRIESTKLLSESVRELKEFPNQISTVIQKSLEPFLRRQQQQQHYRNPPTNNNSSLMIMKEEPINQHHISDRRPSSNQTRFTRITLNQTTSSGEPTTLLSSRRTNRNKSFYKIIENPFSINTTS
ncbi:hypothetical protein SNEBB_003633 [Seison nebaliae]|nr:hypothetical protein SNEBB_003633 [Seison nebaliae]